MLQALRPEDALAIAEISRRRTRDEQAMVQYLGIGRGARANTALPDGTLLRLPGDVDLAAFESEERRRLEAEIARLSPDARRELIALIWLAQRPSLSFEAALRRTRRIPRRHSPDISWGYSLSAISTRGSASLAAAARDGQGCAAKPKQRDNVAPTRPSRRSVEPALKLLWEAATPDERHQRRHQVR